MKNVAISAAIGLAAALLLAAALIGAPYAGVQVPPLAATMAAIALAFGMTVAIFAQTAFNGPAKKRSADELKSTKLRALKQPASESERPLIRLLPATNTALKLVVKPDTTADSILGDLSSFREKEAFVTIKKTSEKAVFNPIYLKAIFKALKDNENYTSILLRDENSEYAGYIPGSFARQKFTGADAESQISQKIVDTLKDPGNSAALRTIDGIGANDWISDDATVSEAAKRMARDQLRGLVVLEGGRHRRPVAVVYLEDLAAAMLKD